MIVVKIALSERKQLMACERKELMECYRKPTKHTPDHWQEEY